MKFAYRILEESDGMFSIQFKQRAWYVFDTYETLHDYDTLSKKVLYKNLLDAEKRVLEEIRKDNYPVVIKEYK